MAKRSVSRRELKKIKKIRAKASRKYGSSSSDRSISDSDSSLSSDSERDKIRHPSERKETDKLDHIVTNNINNKDQYNDAI